jgi:hypothetical protein
MQIIRVSIGGEPSVTELAADTKQLQKPSCFVSYKRSRFAFMLPLLLG